MMDALVDPEYETVIFMTSSQIGKTEILGNVIGYYMSQDPAPILVVQPTVEMAEAWSKDRLAPMIEDTQLLRGLVLPARSRDSGNTVAHKQFPGGHITAVGANAPAGLASRPIRIVLCDEVDRFPQSAGTEGDPVNLARRRADTFWNRKILLTSTPTVRSMSRIEKAFEASDQRRFYVPCPACGEHQVLSWPNLKWENHDPETVRYRCAACGVMLAETNKSWMLANGEWRADNPHSGCRVAGFHINALYSPWRRWPELVAEWLESHEDPVRLQVFVNTILGETWEEEGDTVEAGGLAGRREEYPEVPVGVGLLTCSVDVQGDRLEAQVMGWGRGEECWLIAFSQFQGNPGHQAVWQDLDEFLQQRFTTPSGAEIGLSFTLIDSGGQFTDEVYRFCRLRNTRRVYCCKGAAKPGAELISRPSRNNRYHVALYMVGTDTAKDMIYSRLKIKSPGPGYVHLPDWIDDEWIAQLTAEKAVRRYVKGRGSKREYIKLRPRNEALDLTVYALAALYALGPLTVKGLGERAAELARREPEPQAGQQPEPQKTAKTWNPYQTGGGWNPYR